MTYISGLTSLLELTKEFPDMQMAIHSDRAGVYASKDFNVLLSIYDVPLSMSCTGTPTGNAATETSNELDQGRAVYGIPCDGLCKRRTGACECTAFFSERRSAYSLSYLVQNQFAPRHNC